MQRRSVDNPLTGERIVITHSAADTDGEFVAFEFFVQPTGGVLFEHYHAEQSETFRMKRGELVVTLAGVEHRLRPGEQLVAPPGVRHTIENRGDAEAFCEVEYRPALVSDWWLLTVHEFSARTGREPSVLELAPLLAAGVGLYPGSMPLWFGRLLLPVLSGVSRLLGKHRTILDTVGTELPAASGPHRPAHAG